MMCSRSSEKNGGSNHIKEAELISTPSKLEDGLYFRKIAVTVEWVSWLCKWPSLKQSTESITFLARQTSVGEQYIWLSPTNGTNTEQTEVTLKIETGLSWL